VNHRRTTLAAGLALAISAALTGCSSDSGAGTELKVTGAYVPQPVMGDMAGGFLVISNTGDTADKLVAATSHISDDVQLHETVNNKMQRVKSFDIPANGELELKRGGNHIMFMNLTHKPVEGDKVSVTLQFAESDPITVEVPVKATNYQPQE
jgi:hypothetical protein